VEAGISPANAASESNGGEAEMSVQTFKKQIPQTTFLADRKKAWMRCFKPPSRCSLARPATLSPDANLRAVAQSTQGEASAWTNKEKKDTQYEKKERQENIPGNRHLVRHRNGCCCVD
jgi:hypothetical protein